MGVGVTAVRVGFIFLFARVHRLQIPTPTPPTPPSTTTAITLLPVPTGGRQGDTGSCLSGKQQRAHMPRYCAESCFPTLTDPPPPPTLSTDICNGGGGGLISLGSERTLEKEPTGVNKRLRAVWLGAFSLPLRETDLHLKELFRFRRQNKLLLWLKTGRKKNTRHLFRLFQRYKAQSANLPPKRWSGGQKRFLRW